LKGRAAILPSLGDVRPGRLNVAILTRRQFVAASATAASGVVAAHAAAASLEQEKTPPVRFRLGLVTYNIAATWDLPTLLKVCKDVGISPVELRTTHKHGVEPTLSKEQRQRVRQQFADAGVDIWGCGTVCEFHSPDQNVVKQNIETCKRFIDLSRDLGGKGVKVRPNGLPPGIPFDRTIGQIARALEECGKAAADQGVEIWVEVHGPGTSHPPHLRQIMDQCRHPQVGVTWNSNPSDIKNGSVAEYFQLLRPWIKSCHINEIYKETTHAYPYRELFRLFRESQYDRVTMVEVGRSMPDPVAGAEVLRYYKSLWTELTRG
jgi:sugar phosphate isomerase/epimerase